MIAVKLLPLQREPLGGAGDFREGKPSSLNDNIDPGPVGLRNEQIVNVVAAPDRSELVGDVLRVDALGLLVPARSGCSQTLQARP